MISPFVQTLISVASAALSGGFFSFLAARLRRKDEKEDKSDESIKLLKEIADWKDNQAKLSKLQNEMLLGLAHDRIVYVGSTYISEGEITMEKLDDFNTYLYEPYKNLGGNGTGQKIWERVNQLPIKDEK